MKNENRLNLFATSAIAFCLLCLCSCGQKQQGLGMKSAQDIEGHRIVVTVGTLQEAYAVKHYKKSELMRVDALTDVLPALTNDKADVAIIDGTLAKMVTKKNKQLGILVDRLEIVNSGFIFNKDKTDLKEKFNTFFRKLQESGEYDKIADKWENHLADAQMPALANDGSGGSVVFASTMSGPPFSLIKDGKPGGSDIEVAVRFAAACHIKLMFTIVNFGGIISGVSTGKFDMAGDEIAITEERAKMVDYSIPYKAGGIAAIARKSDIQQYAGTDTKAASKGFVESMKESVYNNIIAEGRYRLLLHGLVTTAVISLLSVILGTLLGALLCFLRMQRNRVVQNTINTIVDFLRGIPPVVFLMILFYLVFTSGRVDAVIVSVIGFSLIFAGYVSEMFRTSVESVDKGEWEAGVAMGFTKARTFRIFVMPLAIQRVLPVYKGEFIGLIKNTAIVGYIAVQDLTKAGDIIRSVTFDPFFPLILVTVIYFLLIWVLTRLVSVVKIGTTPKRRSL